MVLITSFAVQERRKKISFVNLEELCRKQVFNSKDMLIF